MKKVFRDPWSKKSLKLLLKEFIIYLVKPNKFENQLLITINDTVNNNNNNCNNNDNNNRNNNSSSSNNNNNKKIMIIIINFNDNNKILHT